MEDSIEKFITEKSIQSNVPPLIERYLTKLLKIHKEITSPIEALFFIEWHFQAMFLSDLGDYMFIPQYKSKETTGKYFVDFMIIGQHNYPTIAIEIDGHDFHEKTKEQVRKDKIRERFITKNVTKLLRFSGSEIFKDPFSAVEESWVLIQHLEEEKKDRK